MPAPIIENHPQFADIKRRLEGGAEMTALAEEFGLSPNTLKSWWRRQRVERGAVSVAKDSITLTTDLDDIDAELDRAQSIIEKAQARGLTITGVSVEAGDSSWDGWTKDHPDDPAVSAVQQATRRKATVRVAVPKAEEEEARPFNIVPAPTYTLPKPTANKRNVSKTHKTAVLYPDAQIWYWQDVEGEWHTTHDEAAMDVALQVTALVERAQGVDVLVDMGDLVDLPIASKHRSPGRMLTTDATNRALERAGRWFAQRAAAAPNSERHMMVGNHDERIQRTLEESMPWLIGVRVEGTGELAIGLSHLLGAERNGGWKLHGPYPSAELWLNHNTRCIHGTEAKAQPGGTGAAYLKHEVNTFFGHSPHAQVVYRTVPRRNTARTFVAASGGGLMKVTGDVPSQRTGVDPLGQPGRANVEAWEQGILIVHFDEAGKDVPAVELVPIFGGRAVWRGHLITARCDADGGPLGE